MKYIDNFLNGITMYRVVLYGLTLLSIISIFFGFFHVLPYSGFSLIISLLTLFFVCFIANTTFAKIFKVQTNVESVWITAFILYFILFPIESIQDVWVYVLVGVVSMASKYFLSIKKRHIFNPAGIGIFIAGLLGYAVSSWWIGSSVMIFPVLILVFLVLRKMQRFEMFSIFVVVSLVLILISGYTKNFDIFAILKQTLLSSPIIFFGSIMLIEPLTYPTKRAGQALCAIVAGIIFGLRFDIGIISSSPEFSLVLVNIFSYLVSYKVRSVLTLVRKESLSPGVYDFVWKPDKKIPFEAGQYLEWTLAHFPSDSRGNRRYFTIASSPTEDFIHLGVKFYDKSSTFKKKLDSLSPGEKISVFGPDGEFILPKDEKKKLVFMAGGIGITPFISMIKMLKDKDQKKDVVLFYSARTAKDVAYGNLLNEASLKLNFKIIYVLNDLSFGQFGENTRSGFIDDKLILEELSDYKERYFYISGPHAMVDAFEKTLQNMGVRGDQIKTDFFPGYV